MFVVLCNEKPPALRISHVWVEAYSTPYFSLMKSLSSLVVHSPDLLFGGPSRSFLARSLRCASVIWQGLPPCFMLSLPSIPLSSKRLRISCTVLLFMLTLAATASRLPPSLRHIAHKRRSFGFAFCSAA